MFCVQNADRIKGLACTLHLSCQSFKIILFREKQLFGSNFEKDLILKP